MIAGSNGLVINFDVGLVARVLLIATLPGKGVME